MLAAIRAVGFMYMASSAGYVGMRRAGLQSAIVSSRTACDTIRSPLPSSGALAVGRLESAQAGLWTATAGTGQPAPSASRPSASRSCAKPKVSEKFRGDTDSDLGVSEYSIMGTPADLGITAAPASASIPKKRKAQLSAADAADAPLTPLTHFP